jgi:hypothetical protein
MGTIGEMNLEDAAREAAGNWRSWTCFVWDRLQEIHDPECWSMVYTHNRDSGLLAQSNAAVIAEALMSFSETENPDVAFESHAHWAVGHVDRATRSPSANRLSEPESLRLQVKVCPDVAGNDPCLIAFRAWRRPRTNSACAPWWTWPV